VLQLSPKRVFVQTEKGGCSTFPQSYDVIQIHHIHIMFINLTCMPTNNEVMGTKTILVRKLWLDS